MTSRFFATKRSVYVGKGTTDGAYKVITAIMRNTGLAKKVRPKIVCWILQNDSLYVLYIIDI